mgnify:FL=1
MKPAPRPPGHAGTESGPSWFEEARGAATVYDVAAALGLDRKRNRIGPCPACNKERDRDGRPPIGIGREGLGWRCWSCATGGSAIDLAACAIGGSRIPSDWRPIRDWFAARGWCEPFRPRHGDARPSPPVARPAPVRPIPEAEYPPEGPLRALLGACRPVAHVPAVAAWCSGRGLDPAHVPAAVLPDVYPWPGWWRHDARTWRIVIGAVDNRGHVRSLHARATVAGATPKTKWPAGCKAGGLLFADPWRGRALLRGEAPGVQRVIVCEGMTDYLAMCLAMRQHAGTAVLGATSGGFGALADVRWPLDVRFWCAADEDEAGENYAREMAAALGTGRAVYRVRPPRTIGAT